MRSPRGGAARARADERAFSSSPRPRRLTPPLGDAPTNDGARSWPGLKWWQAARKLWSKETVSQARKGSLQPSSPSRRGRSPWDAASAAPLANSRDLTASSSSGPARDPPLLERALKHADRHSPRPSDEQAASEVGRHMRRNGGQGESAWAVESWRVKI